MHIYIYVLFTFALPLHQTTCNVSSQVRFVVTHREIINMEQCYIQVYRLVKGKVALKAL